MRGLKRDGYHHVPFAGDVAPYVGAWIETSGMLAIHMSPVVAPYVGAWIESKDKGTETFGIFAPPRMLHL